MTNINMTDRVVKVKKRIFPTKIVRKITTMRWKVPGTPKCKR